MGLGGGVASSQGGWQSLVNMFTSGTGSSANTYSPGQTALQGKVGTTLSSLLDGVSTGTNSPNVQAVGTQNANQINQSYAGVGNQMNKFLAARGFGKSGATGSAALQTDLSRQSALASNTSNTAGLQLQQNAGFLSDALAAAYQATGNSTANQQNTTTSSSGNQWGTTEAIGGQVKV